MFRERTSLEWSYDWRQEDPQNLITSSMSECERATIFGLCSFHPNGYFREKAIKALSNMSSENAFPYLLIRLNDWVGIVRDCAKKSVKNLIGIQNAQVIVNNLSLVIGLRNCTRYDHSDIINDILFILSQPECYSELEKGLTLKEEKFVDIVMKLLLRIKFLIIELFWIIFQKNLLHIIDYLLFGILKKILV